MSLFVLLLRRVKSLPLLVLSARLSVPRFKKSVVAVFIMLISVGQVVRLLIGLLLNFALTVLKSQSVRKKLELPILGLRKKWWRRGANRRSRKSIRVVLKLRAVLLTRLLLQILSANIMLLLSVISRVLLLLSRQILIVILILLTRLLLVMMMSLV